VLRVNLAVLWWNELAGAVTIRTRSDGSEVYSNDPGQRAGCETQRSGPAARMIILTGSESRHLFTVLVVAPCRVLAAPQAWSDWC
jgi:hypothetical protein